MSDFGTVVFGRRSVRRYLDNKIPEKDISEILEAAIYSPTASNIQPWIFGVIDEKNRIKCLESFSPGMPRNANTIIVVCSNHKLAKSKGGNPILCTLDCAMAGQNIQLSAYDHGIGSCVVCGFNRQAVSALLLIPDYIYVEFLITLGYYLNEVTAPKRKPVEEILFTNQWNDLV